VKSDQNEENEENGENSKENEQKKNEEIDKINNTNEITNSYNESNNVLKLENSIINQNNNSNITDTSKIVNTSNIRSPTKSPKKDANRSPSKELHSPDKNSDKKKLTSMFNINEKYIESFQDSKVLGPKHKQMFNEIKETIESFICEFNQYFYEHLFQKFIEQIQKITDEKYQKYIEISKNYHSQIKEMEFLINSSGDEESDHKESLKGILDALKEEQQNELDRIEDHYNKLINDAYTNFKNFGFKNNSGIQIIEEKFKLDTFNMMNEILNPKSK